MVRILALLVCLAGMHPEKVSAQSCGQNYTVRPADSLSAIAARNYSNAFLWTEIYAANANIIGSDPNRILVGSVLFLPCFEKAEPLVADSSGDVSQPLPVTAEEEAASVAGASDASPLRIASPVLMPPFADARRQGGGLFTELTELALAAGVPEREIKRVPVSSDQVDLIFPVLMPDCSAVPEPSRCGKFLFADPMFELLMLLFVPASDPLVVLSNADIAGKRICRPAGLPVDILDAQGRDWLRSGLVTVVRAESSAVCFDLLTGGKVEAVLLNEFTGRSVIAAAGAENDVLVPVRSPLGLATLTVAIPREAPRAEALLADFNAGLEKTRRSGRYQDVLNRQMSSIWAGL